MTTTVAVTGLGGSVPLAAAIKYATVDWEKSIDVFGEATVRVPAQCMPKALRGAHPYVHELRIEVDDEVAFAGPIQFIAPPLTDDADMIIFAKDLAHWFEVRFTGYAKLYSETSASVSDVIRELVDGALSRDDPNLLSFTTVHAINANHARDVESKYDQTWHDHLKSIVGKIAHMRVHGRSIDFWEVGKCLGELPRVRADQFTNFKNLAYDGEEFATDAAVFGADAVDESDDGPAVPQVLGVVESRLSDTFAGVRVERTIRDETYLDSSSARVAARSFIRARAPLGFAGTDVFRAEADCGTPWPITRVAPGMCTVLGTPLGEIGMQVKTVGGSVDRNGVEKFFIGFEEYALGSAFDVVQPIVTGPPPGGGVQPAEAPIVTSVTTAAERYINKPMLIFDDARNTGVGWSVDFSNGTRGLEVYQIVEGQISSIGYVGTTWPLLSGNPNTGYATNVVRIGGNHVAVAVSIGAFNTTRELRIYNIANVNSIQLVSTMSGSPLGTADFQLNAIGSIVYAFGSDGVAFKIDCSSVSAPVVLIQTAPDTRYQGSHPAQSFGGKMWLAYSAVSTTQGVAQIDAATLAIDRTYTSNVFSFALHPDGSRFVWTEAAFALEVQSTANGAVLFRKTSDLLESDEIRLAPNNRSLVQVDRDVRTHRSVFTNDKLEALNYVVSGSQADKIPFAEKASRINSNGVFYTYTYNDDTGNDGVAAWSLPD